MNKQKKIASKRKPPWRDPDDAPKLTLERAARADLYIGDKLVRPGKGGPNKLVAKAINPTRKPPKK